MLNVHEKRVMSSEFTTQGDHSDQITKINAGAIHMRKLKVKMPK